MPASYWAHGYIAQLTEKGIVNGNGQGLYLPTEAISRAETVRIVNGILDRRPGQADEATLDRLAAAGAFIDLDKTHWAYYEILEATYDHQHQK